MQTTKRFTDAQREGIAKMLQNAVDLVRLGGDADIELAGSMCENIWRMTKASSGPPDGVPIYGKVS